MNRILQILLMVILSITLIVNITSCTKKCKTYCNYRTNIKAGNYGDGFCRFGECGSPQICQSNQSWPKIVISVKINNQWKVIVNNPGLPLDNKGHSPWISGQCLSPADIKNIQSYKIDIQPSTFLVKGTNSTCPNQCILYNINKNTTFRLTTDNSHCGVNIDIKAVPYKDINNQIKCLPCNCSN